MSNKIIGNICYLSNGYAFKSSHYVDGGIRVIRIANVQKGYIEDSTPAFYPLDSKGLGNYMLEEGDLLMSLTGNVGRVALLSEEMLPAALNQRVACLRLKDESIDKKFLFHYLNSSIFENKCIKESKGVAQKNMSTEWLKRQEIPNFTYSKQKEISKALDYVSDIIKAKMKQLTAYDQLIKSRFVDMFGSETKETTLEDVCIGITDGSHNPPKGVNYSENVMLSSQNISDRQISFDNPRFLSDDDFLKENKRTRIQSGDVLLTIVGTIGRTAVVPKNLGKITLQRSVAVLHPDFKKITATYLEQALVYIRHIIERESNGVAQKGIYLKQLRNLKIHYPPIDLQIKFEDFVQHVDTLKLVVQQSLNETQELFDSLMQEYFG